MRGLAIGLLAAGLFAALPVEAVLIASGDGTGNTGTSAGGGVVANVGSREGLSGVYLGKGWVLTAKHVGVGPIRLQGTWHEAVPGSGVRLQTDGIDPADLLLFRIQTDPGLPDLPIAILPPVPGEPLLMAGNGRNRGNALRWHGLRGWEFGSGKTLRWGTNHVREVPEDPISLGATSNYAFSTVFSDGLPTPHECQAATGDSGGAVFVPSGSDWVLAGVLIAVSTFDKQPSGTALFGNLTWQADLSAYRDDILDVVSVSACEDGTDQDGDGRVDLDDPGCSGSGDAFETDASLVCDNGLDDDGDGMADMADPGCAFPKYKTEDPQCQDGVDNDGDGLIDAPDDPECGTPSDDSEQPGAGCGLLGIEILPLLGGAARARRRRRSSARA